VEALLQIFSCFFSRSIKLYVSYLYQKCHCFAALPTKMSVFNSHVPVSHSVISNKPKLHTKKTYSHNNAVLNKQKANFDHCDGKCTESLMHFFTVENELHSAFPNTEAALRMHLCLMVSNCTEERSFSKLRRDQNYLRNSIDQDKLSMLSLLSMEHEILRDTDLETIINDFVCKKWGDVYR